MGLEQVVHILGQAGAAGPVLPYPLPEGEEEVGAVLMLEQQGGLNYRPSLPPRGGGFSIARPEPYPTHSSMYTALYLSTLRIL